ncbi:uncharacterized protein BBOV_IV005120 [Babesia bovis T2Bo]|uniref:Membrane protein, putative n=1 Tax=Babesia bovis TaxID=5865 RepID=A7AQQ4_BABBO|nr:uncharacterized protein BBOV_IV005120 [Babesia bovis T2Bo]EDO06873.1 hypothetical protein BBOV_IV005120 [Babesia bovis T2Bo]BAN64734.1 membrane protein, putative [Babesia bovis]|eukprot:XP_001610441.1 hypothetical protein [Babesia bovis T2Bo]
MKFIAVAFVLFAKFASAFNTSKNHLSQRAAGHSVNVTTAQVEKFRELIKADMAQKVDDLIELIVSDIERALVEANETHPVFLQNGVNENIKKIVKTAVMAMLKHLVPIFENWIADAVKPPVTTPTVYGMLVRPIGKSIFDNIYGKLKMEPSKQWDTEDEMDFGSFDDSEEAGSSDDAF